MSEKNKLSLVSTIRERCRVCYTCVRECPAKAIRISSGQAEVIDARCIGCGNCVRVCSQGAKRVLDSVDDVRALLAGPEPVAACLAPSFPAEFTEMTTDQLVGMVRKLGFDSVHEVGFGADLVAARYKELLDEHPDRRYIATTCPAITSYVERFHPDLVSHLAPVVSPIDVHVAPPSRLSSTTKRSGSPSPSPAVQDTLKSVGPMIGVTVVTAGALSPAVTVSSTCVPLTRSIRATPAALTTVAAK